jgi:hypothetical protein
MKFAARLAPVFLAAFLLLVPLLIASAQGTGVGGSNPAGGIGGANTTTCGGKLCNPLRNISDLDGLIVAVLGIVVKIGTYIAVIFIIWSGFLFVRAQGNPGELAKAKETFLYTIVGVAILLGAQALAMAVGGTVNSLVQ